MTSPTSARPRPGAFCERPAMSPHRPPPPASRTARTTPLSTGHHAIIVVLGVILVSLCFGLVRVVDAAVSGALHHSPPPVALRQAAPMMVDDRSTARPTADSDCVISAVFEGVPPASAEAIDL